MKLVQRHNASLHIFEIKDGSLKIIEQSIIGRTSEEILFQDILIKDLYELKHFKKFGLAYIAFFSALLIHFSIELFMNPGLGNTAVIIFSILTALSIVSFYINNVKIYIPTRAQGNIRLYKNRPNKKRVEEFLYILEGKATIAAKKIPVRENLNHFLKS